MITDLARRARSAIARLTGFRRQQEMKRRYDEEMRLHVDLAAERNRAAGMPPDEARRAALVAFGGAARFAEEAGDQVRSPLLEEIGRDVRYSLRALRRNPAFAVAAIVTLALGIGATTVIYSLTDHVVLRPLAYPSAGRLVLVREVIDQIRDQIPSGPANASHFLEWRRRCADCVDVAALTPIQLTLRGEGDPQRVPAARASANLLPMLGAHAQRGRLFSDAEDTQGAERVVVLTDGFWRRQFGARPDIVGEKLDLGGLPYTVVGVLAPGFRLPSSRELGLPMPLEGEVGLLVPLALTQRERSTPGEFNYAVIARLDAGATPQRVQSELDAIERELSARSQGGITFHALVEPLREHMLGSAARALVLLLAAVGALLLIVCVNLANLLLARNAARAHESAVRLAIGAGRGRLVRQALTESLVLAFLGGAVGMLLSRWGLAALLHFAPATLPRLAEITLDGRVLAVSLLATLAAGIAFGVLPAFRFGHGDPSDVLRAQGTRGATAGRRALHLRDVLVSAQVGLSALLLVATGLLLASFVRVLHVDKGFDVDRALALDLSLPYNDYRTAAARGQLLDAALARLRTIPGVTAAAVTTALPLEGDLQLDQLSLENDQHPESARPIASIRYVSPSYFGAVGTPLRRGRIFSDADRGHPVVVLSARAADALWPGENPIGRRMWPGSNDTLSDVVGVVDDIRTASLEKEGTLIAYVPYWQRPPVSATLVLRTAVDPATVAGSARAVLRTVARTASVSRVRTMSDVMSAAIAQRRFQLLILALFAATALVTASVGIYGVVAHSLTRRTTELGVRMALGARPADVQRLVLRQGMLPVVTGLAVGLGISLLLGGSVRALLYEVSPTNPATLASVALVLGAVAAVACWLPARRATRMDLVRALRQE